MLPCPWGGGWGPGQGTQYRRRMKSLAVLLGALLTIPQVAVADYQEGLLSYQTGRYEQALTQFRTLALTGHPGAEFMLGVMYFTGSGVPRDPVIAAIYFRNSADKGDTGGQLAFGSIYIRGVGVNQDLVEARAWLLLAAHSAEDDLRQQAITLLQATEPLMTPSELSEAEQRARHWHPAPIRNGSR